MSAERISIERAKQDKLFYFVANVVVVREEDGKALILKRSKNEKVHPGKWCVPGGKLEWDDLDLERPTRKNGDVLDFQDAIEDLLSREAKEEAGVDIGRRLEYVNSVAFVRPDGIPVVLVKFAARYAGGAVRIEEGAFTDHAWVNVDEVAAYDCIQGIPEEIAQSVRFLKRHA
ncbi:NUDIX hydrolase [Patescibacteria group bacterium]